MTHAFNDILKRRQQRRVRLGRAAYLFRRSMPWLIGLAITSLIVIVVAGLAEARADLDRWFDWPHRWIDRVWTGGTRPIAPLTGAILVLFVGGWLTFAGMALLRFVLRFGYGPLAVARSVLDEAIRNKTVLVLLATLLVFLAVWPYSSAAAPDDVRQPLRYQIQSFLSFSAMATTLLLGAVTILFSAHSVSQDIYVRRTGDVFVKPISRITYLLGKWIGVVGMMTVILAVQTVIVMGVCRLWLGTSYAKDAADAAAVNQHVLVARGESLPQPTVPFQQVALERVQRLARDMPDLVAQRGASDLLYDIELEERSNFLSIPFGERKEYVFTGLRDAKRSAERLEEQIRELREPIAAQISQQTGMQMLPEQVTLATVAPYAALIGFDIQPGLLQWRFKVSGINTYGDVGGAFDLRLNGQSIGGPLAFTVDRVQTLDLPANYVDDNGVLKIEISNRYVDSLGRQRTLQFDPDTWMQIYHVEGGFAGNVVRASLINLVRLAFLAMLGVIAGALWSFPVAATFGLSFWLLAAGGRWLQETLSMRVPMEVAAVDAPLHNFILPLVQFIASLLSRFSAIPVSSLLVEGRFISPGAVLYQVLWVGIVWMGILVLVGGYLFTRREIARVQV